MNRLHPIVGAISAQIVREYNHGQPQHRHPFITISREPGAGANTLAEQLARQLDEIDPASPPWTAFDRNLTDKVASDYHMSKKVIESIGESSYNWIRELFENINSSGATSVETKEMRAYSAVAKTMWALAHAGRVVLVDRGGAFVTESLPHGVHVRLTAPHDVRVAHIAQERGLSEHEATDELAQLDHKRQAFFAKYWPGRTLDPESFTVTFNTARVDEARIVKAVIGLLVHLKQLEPKHETVPA